MPDSKAWAAVIGPTAMVLAATEALNLHIWSVTIPQIIYFNGIVLFTAGLAIVRAHNIWTADWRVLVTLSGWGTILLGLYRAVAPESPQAPESVLTYIMFAALFAVGCIMTFNAYRPAGDLK